MQKKVIQGRPMQNLHHDQQLMATMALYCSMGVNFLNLISFSLCMGIFESLRCPLLLYIHWLTFPGKIAGVLNMSIFLEDNLQVFLF